jgi:hypothetical protein
VPAESQQLKKDMWLSVEYELYRRVLQLKPIFCGPGNAKIFRRGVTIHALVEVEAGFSGRFRLHALKKDEPPLFMPTFRDLMH